jgi:hypothetical protein
MSQQSDYKKLMAKARQTNAKRDETDREGYFATPDYGPLSQMLKTAMSAVEAGIITADWNAVAEGQAMLEQLMQRCMNVEEAMGFWVKVDGRYRPWH